MQPPEKKMGPGVAAPEPRYTAVEANAVPEYPESRQVASPIGPGAARTHAAPAGKLDSSRLEGRKEASGYERPLDGVRAAYQDSEGRKWRYRGKRARVLDMLVASPGGITPWDCLPWHTRLGASIHAMRKDGLSISTEIEGPYGHARYRLAVALIGDDAASEHRAHRLKNNQSKPNGGRHGG